MNKKLLQHIRKYYSWELPGKQQAMQYFRAAYMPNNPNWPDFEEILVLRNKYDQQMLENKYNHWESNFESIAMIFYHKYKDSNKFNFCPNCKEIARSPTFERCEECGCTWRSNE